MGLDELFYGARDKLKSAQATLHQLLEQLQDGNHGVDASDVADCVKAVAKAISEMDALATSWQEKAAASKTAESVDYEAFSRGKLYYDKPKTLNELKSSVEFNFSKLIEDLDDGE
jgi:hypothetical protein